MMTCASTSSTSTVAEVRRASSPRSGSADVARQHQQGRSRHPRPRGRSAAALMGGVMIALGSCGGTEDPVATGPAPDPAAASESTSADPALAAACGDFWGDPDYRAPQSRVVLDRAGTAAQAGPSDPLFYAMTGDDIDETFADAPAEAVAAGEELSEWFRTQPESGADADLDAFRAAWQQLAGACAEVSDAAAWTVEPGDDGTKPATLVCAQTFDTPGTLPLLTTQIDAVDDAEVGAALEEVRAPFLDALDGDTWSDGLQEPLTELADACDTAGYAAPEPGEGDDTDADDDEEGLA